MSQPAQARAIRRIASMFRNAYALLLLTALFGGGNAVAGKLAIGHISPMLLTTLRWLITVAVLLTFCLPQLRRDWPTVRANLALLFALGTAGFALFTVALFSALHYTTAINVAIEQAGLPMFIFALNFLLYRIGVSAGQIVGFVLSLAGVALTVSHGDPTSLAQLEINFGDALMLVGVIVYAGYTVALRYKPAIHWKSLMLSMSIAGMLASLPFTVWEYAVGRTVWPDAQGWGITFYTVIFASLLSQLFFIRGVELIGANRAGLFINLIPIFGTLLSVAIVREAFHLYHAAALSMVLGGIWLAEHSGRKAARG